MTSNKSLKFIEPKSKYLVFTSAGDHANLKHWLKGTLNFDLWVTYYGKRQDRYKDLADFYNTRPGGKFPNFYYVFQHWKALLDHYEAVMIMDDDIIINGTGISKLFELREQYDLWLLQPAFSRIGKISYPITRFNYLTAMRFTNFVEVTCPLFKKDKLDLFMQVYDPVLVGWGIDWWFLEVMGPNLNRKVAVVDAVKCINPHDSTKEGRREIDKLQKTLIRKIHWLRIKKKYQIQSDEMGTRQFGFVINPALTLWSAWRNIIDNTNFSSKARSTAIVLCLFICSFI